MRHTNGTKNLDKKYTYFMVKEPVKKSMWFDILRENKSFAENVQVQVKDGLSIRFWENCWCGNVAFCNKYPRLYRISTQKMRTIGELFINSWNLQFSKTLDPAERIDLLELRYDIRLVRLTLGAADSLEEGATANKIYNSLTGADPDWEGERIVSSKIVPPKVLFLIWASMHDSIPTRHMLQCRGVNIASNLCLFCNVELETLDHLFVGYGEIMKLWNYFLGSMKICWVMQRTFNEMMCSWRLEKAAQKINMVWKLLPYAICWEVWNERNRRVHGGRRKSDHEMEIAVKQTIYLWSSDTDVFKHFSASQFILHWEDILHL